MNLREQLCSCPMGTAEAKRRHGSYHRPGCLVHDFSLYSEPTPRFAWSAAENAWMDTQTGNQYPVHALAWNLRNLPEWSLRFRFGGPRLPTQPAPWRPPGPTLDIGWAPDYY